MIFLFCAGKKFKCSAFTITADVAANPERSIEACSLVNLVKSALIRYKLCFCRMKSIFRQIYVFLRRFPGLGPQPRAGPALASINFVPRGPALEEKGVSFWT